VREYLYICRGCQGANFTHVEVERWGLGLGTMGSMGGSEDWGERQRQREGEEEDEAEAEEEEKL
jgi:hypothetical protein